jgi:hypothetical protein
MHLVVKIQVMATPPPSPVLDVELGVSLDMIMDIINISRH